MEVMEPGKKASFTENWFLVDNPFPDEGEQIDLSSLESKINNSQLTLRQIEAESKISRERTQEDRVRLTEQENRAAMIQSEMRELMDERRQVLKELGDLGARRGQAEAELSNLLDSKKIKAYIGFDCTAPNLHIGSLMQILLLKKLQDFGHTPIVLIGGATSKIGDPSLKDKSRKMLSYEDINNYINGIKKVFEI